MSLLVAPAAWGQLPPGYARCRGGLGKGVAILTKKVLRAQQSCHKLRSAGSLPVSFGTM